MPNCGGAVRRAHTFARGGGMTILSDKLSPARERWRRRGRAHVAREPRRPHMPSATVGRDRRSNFGYENAERVPGRVGVHP